MLYMEHGADKWLPKITIDTSNRTIQVRAGTSGTWLVATVNTGGMYQFYDPFHVTHPSLFDAVRLAITAALGSGGITVEGQDNIDALDIGASRMTMTWTGGQWQIGAGGTFDLSLLGIDVDQDAGPYTSTVGGVMQMPLSYRGPWWSHTPWGGGAFIKAPDTRTELEASSKRLWEADIAPWDEQRVRTWWYQYQPEARLMATRGRDSNRARLAGLSTGDVFATFEQVWRSLIANDEVLVVHDMDEARTIGVPADSWEMHTLYKDLPAEYNAMFRDMKVAGNFYELQMTTRIASGSYNL